MVHVRSLAMFGVPLAVQCRRCGRRATLSARQLGARFVSFKCYDERQLEELRLRCRACGSRDVSRAPAWEVLARDRA